MKGKKERMLQWLLKNSEAGFHFFLYVSIIINVINIASESAM
jgi:hypothetical protein